MLSQYRVPWLIAPEEVRQGILLLEKLPLNFSDILSDIGLIQGVINGKDDVFILHKQEEGYFSKELNRIVKIEPGIMRPLLKGSKDIRFLSTRMKIERLFFPTKKVQAI